MYNLLVFEVRPAYDFGSIMTSSKRWCAICSHKFPSIGSFGQISMHELSPVFGSSKEEVLDIMQRYIKETIQRCKNHFCESVELCSLEIKDEE